MLRMARQPLGQSWKKAEIAKTEDISADYMAQIMVALRRAGLVNSQRGMQGGFTLARNPEAISVADVILAVDGAIFPSAEARGRSEGDTASSLRVTRSVWDGAAGVLRSYFEGITVQQLSQKAESMENDSTLVFEI